MEKIKEKLVLWFKKPEITRYVPNDRVLELFRSALSKIKEFEYFDMLSLVATN